MNKRTNPERIDSENPEWTEADFQRARPAREVLPEVFPAPLAAAMLAPRRGRPPKPDARTQLTLRIPPSVLARWKATGPGWQTRMVERLSAP